MDNKRIFINTTVSIIVPIYKVEKYLKKCLDSLINQTYRAIEILLINDGSPDNSADICEEYALKDSRIRVYHKENGGLSDARNFGIELAKGEYTLFVDSDDFIELDAIEKLYLHAKEKELDIVCGDVNRLTLNKEDLKYDVTKIFGGTAPYKVFTGEEYLAECIKLKKYSVAVWTRMYRTSLIKENKIYFKVGLLHEDENWTPRILLAAKKVGYYNVPIYNYFIRDGSITQVKNKQKHIADVLSTCLELENEYLKYNIKRDNEKVFMDYLARLYINTCTFGEYDNFYYTSLVDKKFPLKHSFLFKTKIEAIIFFFNIKLYRSIKIKFS
ncbi:glycosyltransferase [Planomicrobium okeanokoites]|uniref:glycosyltransferase n=1 Tax=Planomicrobium okeanokoites TaxID=244 RepID=UPI00248F8CE8|nr:glycosyltransferase [Planomicrobium okeanokoites]